MMENVKRSTLMIIIMAIIYLFGFSQIANAEASPSYEGFIDIDIDQIHETVNE